MAAALFKHVLGHRCFSVFRGSPLVCAQKKVRAIAAHDQDAEFKAPKLPPKPFAMFLMKKMDGLKQENPNADCKDLVKKAAELWKKLPEHEKNKYLTQFQSQYKEYVNNLYEYYQQTKNLNLSKTYNPVQLKKHVLKAFQLKLGKPSLPASGFINFAVQHAKNLGKPFLIPAGVIEGRREWDQLPQSEKDKYRTEAKLERKKYQENLLNWEKKMLEEGHDLLVRGKSMKQLKN